MIKIAITKFATSILFIVSFYVINLFKPDFWFIYSTIWLKSSVIGVLGDILKPDYIIEEALISILSEVIYFILAAFILNLIL
ncbi:MAG: hypothetical protein GF317_05455 [Candidatus Lokiarchaeota archaeon]|nr:hypothetical protein [Candidatus Lokiarchaeota archaeon]MBD3199254.1 hypothetical protein [Candidatus Lokiarchaeota archaeon]